MTEDPNAVAVRRGYEAWNTGNLDVLGEYFSDLNRSGFLRSGY